MQAAVPAEGEDPQLLDETVIVGPLTGVAMTVDGQLPSGTPLALQMLVLGEAHVIPSPQPGILMTELLTVASKTAAARNVCLDVFLETPGAHRSTRVYTGRRTLPVLNQFVAPCFSGERCPLEQRHTRIHAFDMRVMHADWTRRRPIKGDDTGFPFTDGWPAGLRYAYVSYLSGLGPRPDGFVERLQETFLHGNPQDAAHWIAAHEQRGGRIRRRTVRMPWEDVGAVLHAAYLTTVGNSWGMLMSGASDVYLVLRMIAPYHDRPQRIANACGPPRHCIVYAGACHADHLVRTMTWLVHGRHAQVPLPTRPPITDHLPVNEIAVIDSANYRTAPPDTVGHLLERIGLGAERPVPPGTPPSTPPRWAAMPREPPPTPFTLPLSLVQDVPPLMLDAPPEPEDAPEHPDYKTEYEWGYESGSLSDSDSVK
jgi:hypothetical protein